MKKGLMALAASAMVCSVAFASPSVNEPSFTGLNATEHTALFGESVIVQVVALDGAEMKTTEGKFSFKIGKFNFKFFEKDSNGYKSIFQLLSGNKTVANIKTVSYSWSTSGNGQR
jgi:hypothetical protein